MPFFSWKSKNRMTVQSAANDFPFCCKRFFNLLRTIFGRTDIRLTGFTMLKPDKGKTRMFSGFTSLLSHLPQTVFRPKRFASFRPLLYQHFKVNFLPSYPSPKFHRKTGRPHETVFNKIAFELVFNTLRWRVWHGSFHIASSRTDNRLKAHRSATKRDLNAICLEERTATASTAGTATTWHDIIKQFQLCVVVICGFPLISSINMRSTGLGRRSV